MARESVRRAAVALKRHTKRTHDARARSQEFATVRRRSPLTAELDDGRTKIVAGEDLVIGQWVRRYDASHGIRVGDTLAVSLMANGDWLASEVISDTRVNKDLLVPRPKKKG